MKAVFVVIILFFSVSFYGQKDTIAPKKVMISEVSVKSDNVIYVGVKNRIFIKVPNPETLTASSPGLSIEDGKFYISPTTFYTPKNVKKEQTLFLTFKNEEGMFVNEQYTFEVKTVPIVMGFINDMNCEKCVVEMKKEELKYALITLKFYNNILPEWKFTVTGFTVMFPKEKRNLINIKGDKISDELFEILNKLKIGTEFYIWDFKFKHNISGTVCKTTPIRIKIVG